MKSIIILLLVGYASATLLESFERQARDTIDAFANGLNTATPLHKALEIEDSEEVQRLEIDIKEELKKHIKKQFEITLKKIEDAVDEGKEVNQEALEALRDIRDKMIDLHITDEDITEDLEVLKAKVDGQLKIILEKMGLLSKRSAEQLEPELFESVLGDLSVRDMFRRLKQMLLEKLDAGAVKHSLAKIIGQGTQNLCEWLTNKGKEKVLNFFDRVLETDETKKKRASEDRIQEVKDYLENIQEDVDKKLEMFRNWLHDLIGKGLDESKERLQKVTDTIKKIISESKNLSKERLSEVLEHLRQFEGKFGSFQDLRNIIQKILYKEE